MGIYVGNSRFIYSSQGEYEVVEKRLSAYTGKLVGVRSFLTDGTGTSNPAPAKPPVNNDAESKGDKVIEAGKNIWGHRINTALPAPIKIRWTAQNLRCGRTGMVWESTWDEAVPVRKRIM